MFTGVTVTMYPLLYVGNIIFIASTSALVHWISTTLQHEFTVLNLGPLPHFLDIEHRSNVLFPQQRRYNLDILVC